MATKASSEQRPQKQKKSDEIIQVAQLKVVDYGSTKGKGVEAVTRIAKGEYVISYGGEIITEKEAKKRMDCYEERGDRHFYQFTTGYKKLVVDATEPKKEYGIARYMNHSRYHPNLLPYKVKMRHPPYVEVRFIALRDITPGEELLYDYGDRSVSFDRS
jgi:[histone H4]-lysine20 N-methyltransferase SETD8